MVNIDKKEETLLEKANKAVWENAEEASRCPFRLNYHIMAPSNWLNDPNGLIQYKGEYHVFYQHHPYSSEWGPMYWGHVKSRDLVNWEHMPVALAPDKEYEKGCFSGSAVDDNGILTLIYTAHDEIKNPKELQCIAYSTDGINFTKDPANPVISDVTEDASEDFRDPKVWKHENKWYMVVGTGKDGNGKALLYSSYDLRNWDYKGVVFEGGGKMGDMWECPDLFELGDKDVFVMSPMNMKGSKNLFVTGKMDYKTHKFTKENLQEADSGDDFYAAQTFMDDKGRRILIAWMDMWKRQFPTQKNGWMGALTIPRELSIKGDKVISKPVEELKQLRENGVKYNKFSVEENKSVYLKDIKGNSLEMKLKISFGDNNCSKFGLVLRASKDKKEKTVMYYDTKKQELVVDKSVSGEGDRNVNITKINLLEDNTLILHIFIDKSSSEIFVNEGETVITNRIYPDRESIYYDMFTEGGSVEIENFEAWTLKSVWK